MRAGTETRYLVNMTLTRTDQDGVTPADRCMSWISSTSIVFPAAALVVSVLSFFTAAPTPGIVAALAIALVPWALVAGGIKVPALVVIAVSAGSTAWLVIRLDDQAALFLGVVTCTWVAAQGLRWMSALSIIAFTVVSVGCEMVHYKNADVSAGWIIWSTGMLFGWFAGTLLFRQQLLTDQLAAARLDLARAAAEHERKAIAREVHDIVGHSLTVVLLNIAGARRHLSTNPAAAAEALERAESISRDSLETVRSVVGLLSTNGDSQRDAPLPGGSDVVPLLDQARRSGLPVSVDISGNPGELEPALGLTIVRLLQEALANASRHAPGETIEIGLRIDPNTVTATVSNSMAHGTPATSATTARAGLGVASMTDRVAAVNGSLDVGVRDGRWVVHGVLPRSMSRNAELSLA